MENNLADVVEEAIRSAFPEALEESLDVCGILNLRVKASALKDVCKYLFADKKFTYLADITAIDWTDRIELVYQLTALEDNIKLALRVNLDRADPKICTLTDIWKGAEFQEREVFDLMGVIFENHPDLRRILLPEDWEGYPLRKDYVNPD